MKTPRIKPRHTRGFQRSLTTRMRQAVLDGLARGPLLPTADVAAHFGVDPKDAAEVRRTIQELLRSGDVVHEVCRIGDKDVQCLVLAPARVDCAPAV